MSVDWPTALTRAKRNAGDWVLAGELVPRSALATARRRGNLALRELEHPLEAKMTPTVGDPPRGNLYVRYLGPREEMPREAMFRTVLVSRSLKRRVQHYAKEQGTTVTALVEAICQRVARRGVRDVRKPEENTTLNLSVNQEIWEAAMARARRDEFALADAIRDELARLVPERASAPPERGTQELPGRNPESA